MFGIVGIIVNKIIIIFVLFIGRVFILLLDVLVELFRFIFIINVFLFEEDIVVLFKFDIM